jgi:hypothetical protein
LDFIDRCRLRLYLVNGKGTKAGWFIYITKLQELSSIGVDADHPEPVGARWGQHYSTTPSLAAGYQVVVQPRQSSQATAINETNSFLMVVSDDDVILYVIKQ